MYLSEEEQQQQPSSMIYYQTDDFVVVFRNSVGDVANHMAGYFRPQE
jgi:hypothetical protein